MSDLDEWSARRRNLYLIAHNTHKKQTSMFPVKFEPAIPASEQPHTHKLDRTANRIGLKEYRNLKIQTNRNDVYVDPTHLNCLHSLLQWKLVNLSVRTFISGNFIMTAIYSSVT
jgi:hypothetical protein